MKVTWENESLPIFDQRSKTSNYCKKRQIPKYREIQDSIPKITEIVLGGINIYRILRLARGQTPKDDGIFYIFYTFFFNKIHESLLDATEISILTTAFIQKLRQDFWKKDRFEILIYTIVDKQNKLFDFYFF